MRYLPHTPEEITAMLQAAGLGSIDELFAAIPAEVQQQSALELEPPLDETALMAHLAELAAQNRGSSLLSFVGAGAYDHIRPQATDQLLLRSELYTAYTPYQPEVAQGTLQIIFEFQTIVSEILGLPVANASMYDASTALAEAVLMARRLTKRDRVVMSECVHPDYRATVATYTRELDGDRAAQLLVRVPLAPQDGGSDVAALAAAVDDRTACVVAGYPGFLGCATDLRPLAAAAHERGALLITVTEEPYALAILQPPGALGADIAVAEGQALAVPPQYGGPGVGLFACRSDRKLLQQLPGRLCGETVDQDGKRGYVLTLATREQHIRRERATSNICTNSGLCATALTINACLLGKRGFVEAAEQCLSKAEYLKAGLCAIDGVELISRGLTFNELAVAVRGGAQELVDALKQQGIFAGLPLGRIAPEWADWLLLAVTEKHSKAEIERLCAAVSDHLAG